MIPGLLKHVVASLSPETLAREDAEALRHNMPLQDWIELRACGLRRAEVPPYVEYEVSRTHGEFMSISLRTVRPLPGEFPTRRSL